MAYGRPWYVQLTDAVHRLTVLSIIGGSVYFTGGLAMTLWANRNRTAPVELAQGPSALEHQQESSDN